MNALREAGSSHTTGGAVAGNPALEIDREMSALHDRLTTMDMALSELVGRLVMVMRQPDPPKEDGTAMLNPLTSLGTLIRSASGRVEVHTGMVADILRRLEIQ